MFLFGRIVLDATFLPVFYHRLLEHTGDARELHTSELLLAMDTFLPEFARGEAHLFETCTLRFDPKNCVLFGRIDLDVSGSISWNTQPNCFECFSEATDPFPPLFFGFLLC